MADKTPVRVVFNSSSVATGLAEYQSGETVPVANGGTGLSSIGSAGQVLKVNGAGTGLEFGAEGDISITNLVAPTNADLTLTTSGTGNIILDGITVRGTTLSAADSSTININEGLNVDGVATVEGAFTASTSLTLATGATVTGILDEDGMGTDSATQLATQQSIKAYVDASGLSLIDEDNMASDSATRPPSQQSVKAYADTKAVLTGSTNNQVTTVTGANAFQGEGNLTFDGSTLAVTGAVTISGDLTVSGDTTTVSSTNTTIEDNLLELNTGISQSLNDSGIIIERGSTGDNAGIIWDESADKFVLGTTTATAADKSSGITITPGTLEVASLTADSITITDNIISTNVTNANLELAGNSSGIVHVNDSLKVGTGATVTTILDEDAMGTDSATALATQQSIKAYVDAKVTAEDLDITSDSGTIDIDLDSETLTIAGGTGLSSSASSTTVTLAIDSTVVTKTDTQTLTNKTLTSPTITGPTVTGGATIDSVTTSAITTNSITSNGSNADLSLQPSGTGDVLISALRINGTTLDSSDSSKITIAEALDVTGAVTITSGTITGITDLTVADGGTGASSLTDNAVLTGTGTSAITAEGNLSFNGSTLAVTGAATISTTLGVTGASTLDGVTITDNTISSNASNANLEINANGSGTVVLENLSVASDGATVTGILDEDAMGSDSATKLATQQSIKAYADTKAVLTGSTNNTITTVTGAHAFQGEANLTFDGTDMLVASSGKIKFTDANESIHSDGTNLTLTSGGTSFKIPTSDGSNGQSLVTDGDGTLSFATVSTTVSDDSLATVRNNKNLAGSIRTLDSFNTTYADSVLYFGVQNDLVNETVSSLIFTVANNDSAAFINSTRGVETAGGTNFPTITVDVSNTMVRVRAVGSSAESKMSFYRIPLSTANTADATSGNTVITSNTDVDSASESIDSWAHGTYRAAKYFISVDNNAKTEVSIIEALVVHDGSTAYISSFGDVDTGSNSLLTLTAAISGSNVVVSASGGEANLNLTIHKILLKDSMTAASNANQKAIGAVTVSSTATAIDTFDLDDANGAVYYVVGGNGTEGHYSVQEIFAAATPGVASVAQGPFVSTKGTTQLEFTAAFDTASENAFELFASSTSGGSTTVNAYRINCLAG